MHISIETGVFVFFGVLLLFCVLSAAAVAWGIYTWRRRR